MSNAGIKPRQLLMLEASSICLNLNQGAKGGLVINWLVLNLCLCSLFSNLTKVEVSFLRGRGSDYMVGTMCIVERKNGYFK